MSSIESDFNSDYQVNFNSCAKLLHFDERSKYFGIVFTETTVLNNGKLRFERLITTSDDIL